MSTRARLAIDAAGGDNAPEDAVRGAIKAAKKHDVELMLVGPSERLEPVIGKHGGLPPNVRLVPSGEPIVEGESATYALRRKSDCSVAVASRLVRDGEADAVISAGSIPRRASRVNHACPNAATSRAVPNSPACPAIPPIPHAFSS